MPVGSPFHRVWLLRCPPEGILRSQFAGQANHVSAVQGASYAPWLDRATLQSGGVLCRPMPGGCDRDRGVSDPHSRDASRPWPRSGVAHAPLWSDRIFPHKVARDGVAGTAHDRAQYFVGSSSQRLHDSIGGIYHLVHRTEGIMPLIKPRTRGKRLVRHRTRLDHETNETLYAYAQFLGESTEYVLNQVIDGVLAKDKDFQQWRAEHPDSYVPRTSARRPGESRRSDRGQPSLVRPSDVRAASGGA